jgi:hypothetical protein
MAQFPSASTIPYKNPEAVNIQFKTLVSAFDEEGAEVRKQKWVHPKRNISLTYEALTKANGKILWDFYLARKGAFEAFSFFLGLSNTYTGEYVGTGDGVTVAFNLPAKDSASYALYVDNVLQVENLGVIDSGTEPLVDTTLTMADGSAAADFSDAAVFAAGNYIVITDSAGKEAKGWFGALTGTEMTIFSERAQTNQNWESIDAGFDPNDAAGFTWEVYSFQDYAFDADAGTDGADRVTFQVAPTDGAQITYNFTGTLKIRCRFAEDNMTYETFFDRLFYTGLGLKGLLNA